MLSWEGDKIMKSLKELDTVLETAESAIEKIEEIDKMDISEEEKKNLAKEHNKQLVEIGTLYENIFSVLKNRTNRKVKISYYSLSELVRKHKNFVYAITTSGEKSIVEESSDQMYKIIREVCQCEDEYMKSRLGQLYMTALKKNLNSFKDNVKEIFEKYKDELERDDLISEFYGMYMSSIVEAVVNQYNKEIDERLKAEKELEEKRIAESNKIETADDIIKPEKEQRSNG